jgi:hypothetical protein
MIGSTSLFGAASYYQGANAQNVAKHNGESSAENNVKTAGASDGLTESQRFTQRHAGLSSLEYITAYFESWQQKSPELLKSGKATDTFSVRFNDRTYAVAGKKLDVNLQTAKFSDTQAVPLAQMRDVPKAPSLATGKVDLTA